MYDIKVGDKCTFRKEQALICDVAETNRGTTYVMLYTGSTRVQAVEVYTATGLPVLGAAYVIGYDTDRQPMSTAPKDRTLLVLYESTTTSGWYQSHWTVDGWAISTGCGNDESNPITWMELT